ncbi:MAG: 8-amino-7-oxononanoate synthase [Candidatus Ozemobacter sibiricus]|jgi:8-amino-7-oxononanoate synthase|uniref:8-amino-7-oxononanoate synthase n=1 Tax=Candidatus Ozemobacter sibiricus TaxID=2268124 RepID=A0A367ZM34_9BACT|nr:MAG: 8-amino-7-oxononanoate synthase [Candidatus Ozemobacter sibiricus]
MDVANFDVKALLADQTRSLPEKMALFHQVIEEARRQKLYLFFRTTTSASTNHIEAVTLETGQPKEMVMMASNNYLGLTTHPEVVARTKAAIDRWGIGMAGPCTLNGNTTLHQEFEARLAAFKHCEAAMLFPSGYAANIGLITALLGPHDWFIGDELNHASLIDGARYSRAQRLVFKHSDLADLERCLREVEGKPGQKLVAVDGVYSMDGEIAPLRPIVDLCKKYRALLLVDDAHGTGAVGQHGRGSLEYCGVEGEVDFVMGTFSKAFGCYGGFIASRKVVINWLRHFARSGMFTAAVAPMTVAACLAGLDIIEQHPELVAKLHENAALVRRRLTEAGFELGGLDAPIIPIFVRSREKVYAIVKEAYERGLFLSLIEYPAVAPGTERIRLTVMATHTPADLEFALSLLIELGRKYGVIGRG